MNKAKAYRGFILPAIIFLLIASIFPLLYSLFVSFHNWNLNTPNFRPKFIGLANYFE